VRTDTVSAEAFVGIAKARVMTPNERIRNTNADRDIIVVPFMSRHASMERLFPSSKKCVAVLTDRRVCFVKDKIKGRLYC